MYKPFLIADYKTGLETDLAPWMLPQDAFQVMENCYLRHGQIRKRAGFEPFGTLSNGTQVTGIFNFVTLDGGKEIIATDTRDFYRFNTTTDVFNKLGGGTYFTNNNYVWFSNFGITGVTGVTSTDTNTLYLTNNQDRIFSYKSGAASLTPFFPQYGSTGNDVVATCLMIFTYKGRLVLINTWEGATTKAAATNRPQRIRFSQRRNSNVWRDDIPGQGGFLDLPTGDFIVSARLLQDTLIIFCTNSTWAVRSTTDPNIPFRIEKINSFRSCGATFGTVAHDRFILSCGETGIVACDGIEVRRIDERIEEFVNNEINTDLFSQIYSKRDYVKQKSWTLYPPASIDTTQNERALIRMEDTGSFSVYTIHLSCMGQGETFRDPSLGDFTGNRDYALGAPEIGDLNFLSFYEQLQSDILLGGDYNGNIYTLEKGSDDDGEEIPFSLTSSSWNPFVAEGIEAQMGWIDIYAGVDANTQLTIDFFTDDMVSPYASQTVTLVPQQTFIDSINSITQANPANIEAFDHGLSTGNQVYISGVLGMTAINGGPYTITVVDDDNFTLDGIDSTGFDAYIQGGVLTETDPGSFLRTWIRAYAGGIGRLHNVRFSGSGINQNVVIHSITPYFRPVGGRLIG